MSPTEFEKDYRLKAGFVFAFVLYCLFYRFTSATIVSALGQPQFLFEEKDWVYKLFLALHIPHFLTSSSVIAALFDVVWYSLPILFLLTMQRRYAVLFTTVTLIYFVTYNTIAGHQYHSLAATLVISMVFWSKDEMRFNFLWQCARYFWLFIFVSAAFGEIWNGSVWSAGHYNSVLKSQHLNLLLQHPATFKADIASFLIANMQTAHIVLLVFVFVQLFFVVGFITNKLDGLLFALAIALTVANYYLLGIVSFELLALNFTLLNWQKVSALSEWKLLKRLQKIYT